MRKYRPGNNVSQILRLLSLLSQRNLLLKNFLRYLKPEMEGSTGA